MAAHFQFTPLGIRAARQAALAAKTRVTVVSGELYYLCSTALGAAEAAHAVRCGAASELDQALASEAELLVRFLHPGVTAAEVREIFAQHGPLTFVRIGCSTHADTPKEHKLGLEYNVATIGFVHGIDAAGARIALDNEDLCCAPAASRSTSAPATSMTSPYG